MFEVWDNAQAKNDRFLQQYEDMGMISKQPGAFGNQLQQLPAQQPYNGPLYNNAPGAFNQGPQIVVAPPVSAPTY